VSAGRDDAGQSGFLAPGARSDDPRLDRGAGTVVGAPRAPSIGTEKFTDEFLDALRGAGDPPADAAVATFFEATAAEHSELFRRLARSSATEVPDEELPGVGPFVTATEPWPAWADPRLVRRGQDVFGEWGPQLSMGLWMASLPADYACAKGAEPLARTARLTRNPKRRYMETGQMIIDAMTPEALQPGGRGYRTVRHVRLMHAAVRHVLLNSSEIPASAPARIEPWDDALGVPLNQEDLLGCLFSFSVVGIESLKRSGVRLGGNQVEAYIHAWNLVGHQIGIRDDLLPLDWADAKALWDRICALEYGPSDAGRELTAAAISCMQGLMGSKHFRGLPATGIRHYLGDETADLLGVPPADWTRAFFTFVQGTDSLVGRVLAYLPGNHSITAAIGRHMLRGFERVERGGDRPSFQITDELKQSWGMTTPLSRILG
jgi:hypothetical protein